MTSTAHSTGLNAWQIAAIVALFAIAGFFLLGEHRVHALGLLPWILLLACPFLHVFMHGHHGHEMSERLEPDEHMEHHTGGPQ